MAFASSNRTALRVVKETVFNTTPASPVLDPIRYTGESLNFNLSNITSNEIRSDRMTSDLIQVQSDASGDINFELSYGSFDELIEGAMASTYGTVTNVTATDIDASATDDSFNSVASAFGNIVDGQWIRVSGFSNSANNGVFKVTTATSAKLIVGSTLVTESAGPSVTVKAEMARNGTELMSFTFQKHLQDPTTPTFFNFTGARVGSMSLDFQTGQILTGSLSVMAIGASTDTSQLSGATVNPSSSSDVMNAVSNLSLITIDGSPSTAKFSSLTLNLNNNLRAQDAIGSLEHVGVALGRLEVTGNISIYFEDSTMYDKYLNATSFALSFAVQDSSLNTYVFTMNNVKFESGTVVSGGLDTDVLLEASWRAIVDPATSSMIQIDRI